MRTRFGNIEFRNGQGAFSSTLRLAEGPIDLSWHHCSTTSAFLGEMYALRVAGRLDFNEARGSGLGLLTLMSDYGVRLGWTFEKDAEGEPIRLETYAALKLS